MNRRRSVGELVAMGIIAGLVAFGLSYVARPHGSSRAPTRAAAFLETRLAIFEPHVAKGLVTIRSRDGSLRRDIDLAVVVDGTPRPLAVAHEDLRPGSNVLRAIVPIPVGDAMIEATLELRADVPHDALSVVLVAPPVENGGDHTVSLRAETGSEGQVVFVPGVGPVADRATVNAASLTIDADPHPLAILSPSGPITIDALIEDPRIPADLMRVSVMTGARPVGDEHLADLRIVVGQSSQVVWRTIAELAGIPTAPVRGRVAGTTDRALVFGRDAQGNLQVRAHAGEDGAFALDVPATVVQYYAAIEPGRASAVSNFVPGTPRDLVLDVSPGGDLHVTIVDADGRLPLTARLLVHGVEGTVDPNFGPDYRASGAGPVIDALRGDVMTPLPSGRYRVAATRGIEWSIDAKVIDIAPGRATNVTLAPRHVVPTPGVLGCDLHVHARPSFDTPVTPEDRIVSLVAAGVDFAVPTEHNIVGDYSSALETLDLGNQLHSVTGVEVTTYSKGFGHFGVFPFPPSSPVPPFKHSTLNAIFRAVRADDPNRYFQLNHPRLPKGIGYFGDIGFDPKAPRSHIRNRIDFDGIEVFNGYDAERPDRIEQVLRDYWALLDFGWRYAATGSSDSHRIQFHWAGYPRTMVTLDPHASVDNDDAAVDPLAVVANIKKGHSTVTSGPIIEFQVEGAQPGDEAVTTADPVHGHIRVRAAPWIDLSRIEVMVGAHPAGPGPSVARTFDVRSRPTELGPEDGTLEEARARTIRFDQDVEIPVGSENTWVQVIARGERRMDDVLPFMPVPPFGFTNPIYIVRHPQPPPPFPLTPYPRGAP